MPRALRWSEIRTRLEGLSSGELRELLRALFESSAENRRVLAARLLGGGAAATLDECRERIAAAFPLGESAVARPRLAAARRVVREYRAGGGSMNGSVALLLSILEQGIRFGRAHGDVGDAYYAGLSAVLADLVRLLHDSPASYAGARPRLEALAAEARGVGPDFGAEVREALAVLDREA